MAINSFDAERDQLLRDNQRLRNTGELLANKLMIASQRINLPGESGPYQDKTSYPEETEGQKLEKSGQYLKDPETEVDTSQPLESRMFDIDPKKHKTQQKQKKIRSIAEEGATEGERQAGKGKLKDQTQLPKFFKAIIDAKPSPADLLKILPLLLPAFTGGGSPAMAHVNEDGTAHDWRAPDHGGLQVPGGEVNPHGRRGTNTWDDGRQRYTPEELKQIENYMKSLEISQVNYGKPTKLDNYFKEVGYPNRDQPDWLRLKIMRGAPKA